MSVIYEPKGRAREYAALAFNGYETCAHACIYCYAPLAMHKKRNTFHTAGKPRDDILQRLAKDAASRQKRGLGGQVLLCVSCDPYQPAERLNCITRNAIKTLHATGHTVCILTKAGEERIQVDFTYDLDCLVTVEAVDKISGIKAKKTVNWRHAMTEKELKKSKDYIRRHFKNE